MGSHPLDGTTGNAGAEGGQAPQDGKRGHTRKGCHASGGELHRVISATDDFVSWELPRLGAEASIIDPIGCQGGEHVKRPTFGLLVMGIVSLVACGGSAQTSIAPTSAASATSTNRVPTPTVAPAATAVPTATPRPAGSAVSTVRSVTSPVAPSSNATVTVTTAPAASCSITVTYNSGPSKAAGLGPKNAAGNGAVSWTWKVGSRTAAGTYPIDINCTPGGSAQTHFTVS
jgi:hypothetical protein